MTNLGRAHAPRPSEGRGRAIRLLLQSQNKANDCGYRLYTLKMPKWKDQQLVDHNEGHGGDVARQARRRTPGSEGARSGCVQLLPLPESSLAKPSPLAQPDSYLRPLFKGTN